MSIFTSGVNSDSALFLDLKIGPSPTGILTNTYWPEVTPGFFTAGTTIHNNSDYLYARENRLITDSVNGLFTPAVEINRSEGPILASWCPDSVSGSIYTTSVATTGWISRDTNFKPLTFSVCRDRLIKLITSWTLVSSSTYDLYSYTVPAESEGFGPVRNGLVMKLEDSSEEWSDFKYLSDFLDSSTPGLKQWCATGNVVYVKVNPSFPAPTGLSVSYISGQASLDVEELAWVTDLGIPLSVGTKDNISNIEIQLAKGGSSATGSVLLPVSTLPRYVDSLSLPTNTKVIVRYRPSGVYGATVGASGVVLAGNLSQAGVVVFRYEGGVTGEKFSPGSHSSDLSKIEPVLTQSGFYLGVAPNHYLHSTTRKTILSNGSVPSYSKIFGWLSHSNLTDLNAPIVFKCVVIGQDDVPVPFANVYMDYAVHITGSPVLVTDMNGEAFTYINKVSSTVGTFSFQASIASSGVVIDTQSYDVTFEPSLSDWRSLFEVGLVHIAETKDLPRSSVSSRKQLYVYRTLGDGSPSPYSMETLNISCKTGKLYSPYNNSLITIGSNSGTSIFVRKDSSSSSSFEEPLYIEYSPSESGEEDLITAVWQSPLGLPSATGRFVL